MDLFGKDFICSQEWSKAQLDELLDLAAKMKRTASRRAGPVSCSTNVLHVLLQPVGAHAAEL